MKKFSVLQSSLFTASMAGLLSVLFAVPFAPVAIALFLIAFIPRIPGVAYTVVSNPLIGKSKKAMGNVVFSTWKGINVLKEKQQSVANPNTDGQRQQRSAFAQLVALFRSSPAAIKAGFKKLAVKKSEFNAFVSANLPHAFDYSVAGTATLDATKLIFSKGTIASSAISGATADRSNNTIVVTYTHNNLQPGQSVSDHAIIGVYNITKKEGAGGATTALRSADSASVPMPANWAIGDQLRVSLGFYNPISGESSDSESVATVIVA